MNRNLLFATLGVILGCCSASVAATDGPACLLIREAQINLEDHVLKIEGLFSTEQFTDLSVEPLTITLTDSTGSTIPLQFLPGAFQVDGDSEDGEFEYEGNLNGMEMEIKFEGEAFEIEIEDWVDNAVLEGAVLGVSMAVGEATAQSIFFLEEEDGEWTFEREGDVLCCLPCGDVDTCDVPTDDTNDCDTNGIADECEITSGASQDSSCVNGIPDHCEPDCNGNGVPDACDIAIGISLDDDGVAGAPDGMPDECDPGLPEPGPPNTPGAPGDGLGGI